jgi:hypothetical protein
MSFLTALGGIGQGINQGIKNMQEQDQLKFQKEQQDQMRKQWADQEAVNQQLKGIQQTAPTGAEFYDPNSGVSAKAEVARPTHEVLADQARVYLNSTDPKYKALGLQLADKATQMGSQAKQQAVLDKYKSAWQQIQESPQAAAKWLDERGVPTYNTAVQDGYKVSEPDIQPNGARTYHVFDEKGQHISSHTVQPEQLQAAASKHLRGLMDTELGVLDPTGYKDWYARQNQNEELGIRRLSAEAQKQNADTESARWKPGGVMDRMQRDLLASHERIAQLNRISNKELNPLQKAQLDKLNSQVADETEFTNLLNDPVGNYKELQKLATKMGVKHPEATENKVIHHTNGETEYQPMNKYLSRAKEAFQEAGGHEINSADHNILSNDAKLAKGNVAAFLQSPSAKQALAKGIPVATLLEEFMPTKGK